MNLFDTTLRDGGNVVGDGFPENLTVSIVKALLAAGIRDIEYGNCKGLGAHDKLRADRAPADESYLAVIRPYLPQGRIGMFMLASAADAELVRKAADTGLAFLRVGANAGDAASAFGAVELVRSAGITCRYSLMKSYLLSPSELAAEAKLLASAGVQKITIMDSAGTMFPEEVRDYVLACKDALSIPVGFHGHSNLGLSQANALAAVSAGADEIDCGLLGLARSAGNCSTELAVAALQKKGFLQDVDLYGLLAYLENELIPSMRDYSFRPAVSPTDLVLGLTGCHSSKLGMLRAVAESEAVSLHRLIALVSAADKKDPDEALARRIAGEMKNKE